MKTFLTLLPSILMTGGLLALCGVGAAGMVLSERRSKHRDKQMEIDMDAANQRMVESHDWTIKLQKQQFDHQAQQHIAIMKHIKSNGPRRQPWEGED